MKIFISEIITGFTGASIIRKEEHHYDESIPLLIKRVIESNMKSNNVKKITIEIEKV